MIFEAGGHKRCSRCEEDKPLSDFHKDSSKKDGLRGKCRKCCFESNKAYFSTPHGKKIVSGQTKRKWIRIRQKVACRNILNIAISNGEVKRDKCEICNTTENIEAHHDDYTKPFDVRWLCRAHHNELHGKRINI